MQSVHVLPIQNHPKGKALDLSSAYYQEYEKIKINLQQEAALRVFRNIEVDKEMTIQEVFQSLTNSAELWGGIGGITAYEFSRILLGIDKTKPIPPVEEGEQKKHRNKLSSQQITEFKQLIVEALRGKKQGIPRIKLVQEFNRTTLKELGISLHQINMKIRRPLGELVRDGVLHKVGEKKGLRYILVEDAKTSFVDL